MEAITLPIYSSTGKEVDSVKLDTEVFNGVVNKAVLYQAVNAYRANQRKGLAATKTRGEVSGGGKKPWQQKGTGRARVGSTRSPLWRHGGVVFGPHPKDFSYTVPAKVRKAALKSSLNAKIKDNNLLVLEGLGLQSAKTKDAVKVFEALKAGPKALMLYSKLKQDEVRALRNIGFLTMNAARDTHAYEVLTHKRVVITKDGLTDLTKRLKS
jgi:large subunit ribosomal protein L4